MAEFLPLNLDLAGFQGSDIEGGAISTPFSPDPSRSWAGGLHVVSINDEQLKTLAEQLESSGARVLRLDGQQGLSDLTRWLDLQVDSNPYEQISFYSHGAAGQFTIGGQRISRDSLTGLADEFATLGNHLSSDGDLLIYGCSVGVGLAGEALISDLATLTGADMAASDDRTGSLEGADWDLEVSTGQVGDPAQVLRSGLTWQGSLDLPGATLVPAGIQSGTFVTSAQYYDANGDVVDVRLSGAGSFSLALTGGKTNIADALELILQGADASTDLSIAVIPVELAINGGTAGVGVNGVYNKMYSPGYTSLSRISAIGSGQLGDLTLSAVNVGTIDLKDWAIGSIVLDTGFTTLVDRVNTSTASGDINVAAPNIVVNVTAPAELELFDESPTGSNGSTYNPVAGLIDLGDINAASIGSLIINGSISAPTADPNDDENLTNDLRGTITVSGRIGEIQAQRSALTGAIRSASIGSISVGKISGEISTSDAREALSLNLTSDFRGFIHAAGHINLGFSFDYPDPDNVVPPAEKIYGEVHAGGGISGSDISLDDRIYLPNLISSLFRNTGMGVASGGAAVNNRIADIAINGLGTSRWISAGDIGAITANSFGEAMLVEAAGNIGDIEAYLFSEVANPNPSFPPEPAVPVELNGMFQAGGSIGNVKSATSVTAEFRAGSSIGNITAFTGGIQSGLIEVGQSIGDLWAQKQQGGPVKLVAKNGDIGDLYIGIGDWSGGLSAGQSIGNITLAKGALNIAKISAGESIGDIKVSGSVGGIIGGSLVAGGDIGTLAITTTTGTAIQGALIQAGSDPGDRIAGINALSYGSSLLPVVVPGVGSLAPSLINDGIRDTQILAAEIGTISGRAYTGVGIADTVIHAQRASIDGIVATGNQGGLLRVTAIAEQDLGPVEGTAEVQGAGIGDSRLNANTGSIGVVKGQGGVAGGDGINRSYLQASTEITGIRGTSNANQGDAIRQVTANANNYGSIVARVLGGEGTEPLAPPPPFPLRIPTGSGIVDSYFKGDLNQPESSQPGIESIEVDVKSLYGNGIFNSQFAVKASISRIFVNAYANTAILNSTFSSSRGVIGSIDAEATQRGKAISGSIFKAGNGDIGRLGGIVADANGTGITDHAIENTRFEAANGLGAIQASSKGGTAILASTFLADTDLSGSGRIDAITARTEGQNLASSMGISGSSFDAADIGAITVNVDDFEGGAAISGSQFTTRTATYDGTGNFDNKGSIGDLTIDSLSRTGNGIESSRFLAGAAGSIGNISVDLITRKLQGDVDAAANGSSGKGIYLSTFQASSFDVDQNVWNGKIGNITIKAGRVVPTLLPPVGTPPNDQITAAAAGIDLSYFAAYGGIGNINVDTIGTGVFGSAFLADFDVAGLTNLIGGTILSSLAAPVAGNIGDITIKTNGRFAVGSAVSLFTGAGIGNINIEANALNVETSPIPTLPQSQPGGNPALDLIKNAFANVPNIADAFAKVVTADNRFGLAAVVGSAFAALETNIGGIRITNTGATKYPALASAFLAKQSYGPVSFTPGINQNWIDWGVSLASKTLFGLESVYYSQAWLLLVGRLRSGTLPGGLDPSQLPVALVAIPGNSALPYKAGDVIDFRVNFGAPVQVTGVPALGLAVGGVARQATYSAGSGTSTLIFRYQVQAGDLALPAGTSPDEQLVLGNQLTTTNGSVRYSTASTPIPVVTLQNLGNPAALAVDGVQPLVVSTSNNIAQLTASRAAGSILELNVTFDEVVNVAGTPTVAVKIGQRIRYLAYTRGGGTDMLQFRYTLTSKDLQGAISIGNGSTPATIILGSTDAVTDLAGNAALLSLAAPQSRPVQSAQATPASTGSGSTLNSGSGQPLKSGSQQDQATTPTPATTPGGGGAVTPAIGGKKKGKVKTKVPAPKRKGSSGALKV